MTDVRFQNIDNKIQDFIKEWGFSSDKADSEVLPLMLTCGKITSDEVTYYYEKKRISLFENKYSNSTPQKPNIFGPNPLNIQDSNKLDILNPKNLIDKGLTLEREQPYIAANDAIRVNQPDMDILLQVSEFVKWNKYNDFDIKNRTDKDEKYVGDLKIKDILKLHNINPEENEGKIIFARLSNMPQETIDKMEPSSIHLLLEDSAGSYETVANNFEYDFGIQIRSEGEQRRVEAERKRQWGHDYRQKEVAYQILANKYDNAIALLQNYVDNQGVLNVGFWREKGGNVLKEISNFLGYEADDRNFHFSMTDIIEHIEQIKQENLEKLEQYVHKNSNDFAANFYMITGKHFDSSSIRMFEYAIENNYDSKQIEKLSESCFGTDIEDYVNSKIDMASGIDGTGDIAVMLIGAEYMGAGVMANFGKGFAKIAAWKGGKIIVPMLAGGASLGTWTSFQGSVNAVTKKAPTTAQDLKNVGIASLESFGFGAFGGLIQQTAIAPLMKAIDKPAKQAVQSVATKLELNGQMSMADVVKTTMKVSTQDPSFIAKTAGFVTEVGGFTVYEMVEEVAKDLCTDNGNLPENMTLEDVTKYVGEKFAGQLNNLGGIKFMSNMFMMLKGGRIGQQAVINATLENAKELDNIKVKPITVDGKKQFEITTPDNKKMVVETVDDIITTSQVMLQMQFIKNAKTEFAKPEEVKAEPKPKVETEIKAESKDVEVQNKDALEGGIRAQELEEVAPEARYLIESENITVRRQYIENLEASLKRKMQNAESPEEQQIIQDIIDKASTDNKELIDLLANNESISNEQALTILGSMTKVPDVMSFRNVAAILSQVAGVREQFGVHDPLKQEYAVKLLKNNVPADLIPSILNYLYKGNAKLIDIELSSSNPDFSHIAKILQNTLWRSTGINADRMHVSGTDVKFTEFLMQETNVPREYIADIGRCYSYDYMDKKFVKRLCTDPNFPKSDISTVLYNILTKRNGKYYIPTERGPKFKIDLAERMRADKDCPNELIADIISAVDRQQLKLFDQLYADENIPKSELSAILWLDYARRTSLDKLSISDKVNILVKSLSLEDKTLSHLEKYGFYKMQIKEMIDEIQLDMGIKDKNIPTSEASKKSLFKHFVANNANVENLISGLDLEQIKDGIPLKYSRSEFLIDIQNILKDLDEKEQADVLSYFGIKITDGKMEGIPTIPEGQGTFNQTQLPIIEKIKQKINDFILNNETTIQDPALKELFDSVIQGCPEFTTIVGKVQHATHKYPVDIHTLKVLQEAFKNPEYERLDDESKTVLKFAILLHDLGKHEAVRNPGHYEASAKYAVSILNKYNLPDRVKSRIVETIYNHHWFEAYNKGEIGPEMVSAIFRTPKDLDLAIIMGKADLMGVSDDFHLRITKSGKPEKFEEFWQEKVDALRHYQDVRYGKANLVTDTKFNQTANRKFPTQKVVIDGKEQELQVLNLMDDSTSNDLYKYGFAPGTTKDNARFFAHFNDRLKGLKVFMALSSSPTTESVQSLSLISKANSRSYRQQIYGVITDVDIKNIAQASSENISSGYKKDLKHFSKDLFSIMRTNTFVRDCLIDELGKSSINLTTEEYAQLAEKVADIQYLTQIKDPITVGNKTIPADILQRALETSRDRLFDGDLHSEIVAINPRVKALVARVSSLEECSPEFLRLAKENNLPIILIGHNDKSGINANNKPRITGNEPTPTAKTEPETTPTIEAKPIQSDYKPYEPKLLDVQSKDAFVTFDKYNSVLKPEVEAELRNIATDIHNKAKLAEQEIVDMMERNGLTPDGYEIGHRAKSEQSLYDKLKNYLIENYEKKGNVTIQDAIKNVQDAVGVRTIIKPQDYTTNPDVQALLKAGKRKEAVELATKLQTAEMYKSLETLVTSLKADGVKDFGVIRISNYVSKNGVPYLSQEALNDLKKLADIGYADKNDPAYKQMLEESGLEAPEKDYSVKTKSSGYTAFQANFKTDKGFVFEWQCRGQEINDFAEAEHIQYDVFSGKDVIKGDKDYERILKPTVDLMNPNTVSPETVKYLNKYKSEYYEYLREKELGFKDAKKPEFDSKNYDIQLCAENLIEMHNTIDKIDKIKKDDTKTEVQKNNEINKTIENYELWLNNLKKEATMR